MATPFPLPDLNLRVSGNKCCNNNRSARVVFNEQQGKFEVRNTNILCCVCGGEEFARDENARTWEILLNALHHHYGATPNELSLSDRKIDWLEAKRLGRNLRIDEFENLVGWAKNSTASRSRPSTVEERDGASSSYRTRSNSLQVEEDDRAAGSSHSGRSSTIQIDVRVRSDAGDREEPFDPEIIINKLRSEKSQELNDAQIEEIVGRVIHQIHKNGSNVITPSAIRHCVDQQMEEGGFI